MKITEFEIRERGLYLEGRVMDGELFFVLYDSCNTTEPLTLRTKEAEHLVKAIESTICEYKMGRLRKCLEIE